MKSALGRRTPLGAAYARTFSRLRAHVVYVV